AQPVPERRHAVVIVRKARPKKPENVLVEEVKVPESVHVSRGGMIAHRVALIGICQASEDVPRRGDREEQQDSAEWLQIAPPPPQPAEGEERYRRRNEKYRRDQPFGQCSQSERRPHSVEPHRAATFKSSQKTVERKQKQKAQQRIGNEEAREEENADRGEYAQTAIEACSSAPRAPRP